VERIAHRVSLGMKPHPYLYGNRTVYGVMPDWNPAEIIGIRPKPLALSLYKELITDTVWAYQRDNYGYANLRSFPLLVDFEGLPYIDVRVSFNSFLPKQLPVELAERLVNYYLDRLIETPSLHDKVEFDIIFSCYVLDLKKRLTILNAYGFNQNDRDILANSLIQLTNQIVHNQQGLWKKDLQKIDELQKRQDFLFSSNLDPIVKMYWILEDCKRYGTLPFAGLARAGFIAVQILKSFVTVGIINEQEYTNFLTSVNSISSSMKDDFKQLSKDQFLKKYGHLRPGTYDILSPRYDEAPDLYFDWENKDSLNDTVLHSPFSLSINQLRKIQQHLDDDQLQLSVLELLEFIKVAIESREYSKFIFTKSVSEFLRLMTEFAAQFGISREDCAYINLTDMMMLYSSSIDPEDLLHKSIAMGKKNHQFTSAIMLPPLITQPSEVWSFDIPESLPNFITQNKATGRVAFADTQKQSLKDAIILIPSADPGYDWIFSHSIAGLITKYGGVNSHMAIRAGELGIPAVIGAGEIKYNAWSAAKKLHVDCLNRQVKIL
jgi:glutamine kinase